MNWNTIKNYTVNGLHKWVDLVCNDAKDNTLTLAATTACGAGYGARGAAMAAKTGFTMLERKVLTKAATGALVGGTVALGGGMQTPGPGHA